MKKSALKPTGKPQGAGSGGGNVKAPKKMAPTRAQLGILNKQKKRN